MGMFVNPIALKAIGWKYYILFCCILALFFVPIFFLFPETKGYTLEEIAEVFDGNAADKLGPDDVKVDEQNAAEGDKLKRDAWRRVFQLRRNYRLGTFPSLL
jgi:Sugar (and other) transporter